MGPFISGFVSPHGWRWSFWIGLILAGLTLPIVYFMPETYAPVLLQRRARLLRKETGNSNIIAPFDIENHSLSRTLAVTLSRPFRMVAHESIVSLTCLYISLAYAIFYLYFEAYPIIFEGTSPDVSVLIAETLTFPLSRHLRDEPRVCWAVFSTQ